MTSFSQETKITRFATRSQAESILFHSWVIRVLELEETFSFAEQNGIAYVSNDYGCLSLIPVIRQNKRRYRVSLTRWETSLPF